MWKNHGWIKCNGFLTRLTLLVISLWSSMRVEMSNDQNHGHLNKTRNPYFLFLAVKEGFPKLSFDLLVLILCQGWMAIAWWKSCQRISSSRCLAYCLDKMISLWQEGPINFSLVVKTNTSRNEVSGHNPPLSDYKTWGLAVFQKDFQQMTTNFEASNVILRVQLIWVQIR